MSGRALYLFVESFDLWNPLMDATLAFICAQAIKIKIRSRFFSFLYVLTLALFIPNSLCFLN
jgi:hypothetical protein